MLTLWTNKIAGLRANHCKDENYEARTDIKIPKATTTASLSIPAGW